MKRICIVPYNMGSGGPASFKRKLEIGLKKRNIEVTTDLNHKQLNAVLVINGTRMINKLWECRNRGVRIVQRLGIPNWLHRHFFYGWSGFFMAEIRNLIMQFIRSHLADHVIYQSRFVEKRWNMRYGVAKVGTSIIHNGVDLSSFHPAGSKYRSKARICFISVEGTQGIDPFDTAIKLGHEIVRLGLELEILVMGKVWKEAQIRFSAPSFTKFMGFIPNTELPSYYRGSAFFLSTDPTAACPNSVLESLACGTPVLGYKAGPLPEMLEDDAGICADYAGDPLEGQDPANIGKLVKAALELIQNQVSYRKGARCLAEKRYDIDTMVDAYVDILFK